MSQEFIASALPFVITGTLAVMVWWLFGSVDALKVELDLQRRTIRRLRRKVSEHDEMLDELDDFTAQFEPTDVFEESDDPDWWKQQ